MELSEEERTLCRDMETIVGILQKKGVKRTKLSSRRANGQYGLEVPCAGWTAQEVFRRIFGLGRGGKVFILI